MTRLAEWLVQNADFPARYSLTRDPAFSGKSRKNKLYAEILSTFWMNKILDNVSRGDL